MLPQNCMLLSVSLVYWKPSLYFIFQLMDTKVFVDTDSDIRLARRLKRDISERGRDLKGVLKQYNSFVKPAFDQYIEPCRHCADIVVPRGKYCPSIATYESRLLL